jgi:hypothetical protein
MWEATGIGRGSYLWLEHGGHRTPPLRHLANCAIVLGCKLEDLIEPEWRRWQQFDGGPVAPEAPGTTLEAWPEVTLRSIVSARARDRSRGWKCPKYNPANPANLV